MLSLRLIFDVFVKGYWRTRDGRRLLWFALRRFRFGRPVYLYEKGKPLGGRLVWM